MWSLVFRWVGIGFITPSNLFVHLECFIGVARSKNLRMGDWLIWHWIGLF